MPTIVLRGIDTALVAKIRAYATTQGLSQRDAVERLLVTGLTRHAAQQASAHATNAGMTRAQRSTRARHAAAVRWATRPDHDPSP